MTLNHVPILSNEFVKSHSYKDGAYCCTAVDGGTRCQAMRSVDLGPSGVNESVKQQADDALTTIRTMPFAIGYEKLKDLGNKVFRGWLCQKHNFAFVVDKLSTGMLGELGWSEDRMLRS
ncbi:hypothetical protein LTR37_008547 [Vermiconidia calcicola]|uniref:Uncharacterized protein n=1 Tax=Vermiconidia calcicola TaxID=1690605 RepID=A0ACC3NB00_9PEZI|nr:hypothetical protein LTR37_008547 [Vermiconidia calcicola]